MNTDTTQLLGFGLALTAIAAVILIAMVRHELAPSGGLTGRGRWLLAGGLGTGILAFAAKLGLILFIAGMPQRLIEPSMRLGQRAVEATPTLPPVAAPGATTRYVWQALPEVAPSPAENPWSPAKSTLGGRLFFDPRLSEDGSVACASCHALEAHAGADGRRRSEGIRGQSGARNAPTVWNAAFQAVLFWDGRATSLEEQAKGPLINPLEMGMPSHAEVEQRVAADPAYPEAFREAFGNEAIDIERIAQAIAAYERTLITPSTPYDRFIRGEQAALSPAQVRGMALFESVGCVQCHSGPNFSGASLFPGNAPYRIFPTVPTPYGARYDLGAEGDGVWRIPSLRNVALTAPYFHNGAVDALEEAVRVMASVQLGRPLRDDPAAGASYRWSETDHTLTRLERQPLTDAEVTDIVAFLHALSDERLARAAR